MSKTQNSNKSTRIHFRSLKVQDGEGASRYFLPALQVIAHSIAPLRKALIHFYFLSKSKTLERIEWRTLQAFGQVCQALIAPSSNDEESSTDAPPVDPTQFYKELVVCLKTFESNLQPKDATEALQILMTTIQRCCRALPMVSLVGCSRIGIDSETIHCWKMHPRRRRTNLATYQEGIHYDVVSLGVAKTKKHSCF